MPQALQPAIPYDTSGLEPGFTLIHADRSFLVINKPSGLLSVPGRGDEKQDCLISRVQVEYPEALIVHRLDCDTSGLLVLARGKDMHRRLSILFQDRQVDKRYVAMVDGELAEISGEVKLPRLRLCCNPMLRGSVARLMRSRPCFREMCCRRQYSWLPEELSK